MGRLDERETRVKERKDITTKELVQKMIHCRHSYASVVNNE